MENHKKEEYNQTLLSQSIETSEMTSNPYPTKNFNKKNKKMS